MAHASDQNVEFAHELDPGASVPADRTEPFFDAATADLVFLCFPSFLLNIVVGLLPVSVSLSFRFIFVFCKLCRSDLPIRLIDTPHRLTSVDSSLNVLFKQLNTHINIRFINRVWHSK
jgi:hypothetical protein